MQLKDALRKYFIMGSQNCHNDPKHILEQAVKAGITAFQFREKGNGSLTGYKKFILGKQLRNICQNYRIPFFVNDDIELAEILDADGIHVGQDDVSALELRRRFPNKWVGLSVSNKTELVNSPISSVDYLGVGPIFSTTTKEDAKSAIGPNWIKDIKQAYPSLPIVGIGGITTDNAASVIQAGADGVAIISAITLAEDINKAVLQL
ncbi:MAG: thiamine phosphate synthase [Bacillota bacterium]